MQRPVLIVCCAFYASLAPAAETQSRQFVKRAGSEFRLDGKKFRYAGANNYTLMYASRAAVDDIFESARLAEITVLRIWGSLEIGNADGSNSVHGKANGAWLQHWEGAAPAFNDGETGLERLDYAIFRAGQLGFKLVMPLVNNWKDFGGMDQYVRWRGAQFHDDFYTDLVIRDWYKNWIAHLLNRVNTLNGVAYKDDPAILLWELANEPRCKGSGIYPKSNRCTTETILQWAGEMSAYIKSIDANHLVGSGDEGFYCTAGARHWTENCSEGVDSLALARIPSIDVLSFHLYPASWGQDTAWGNDWIRRHYEDAARIGKPGLLGEFGIEGGAVRNQSYLQWTGAAFDAGGDGSGTLWWQLSGTKDTGTATPGYEGLNVNCPSPMCTTLRNFARSIAGGAPADFGPVADHDTAVTDAGRTVVVRPLSNDIAYGDSVIVPDSLLLDPGADGGTKAVLLQSGSFAIQGGGEVLFAPAAGFSGKAEVPYAVQDSRGRTSNTAILQVTVRPEPGQPQILASFESGVEGWAAGDWQASAGAVERSNAFATHGSYSLQVRSTGGGWFGVRFAAAVDMRNHKRVAIDLRTPDSGTTANIAIKTGSAYTWCQGSWRSVPSNTTVSFPLDFEGLACGAVDLSKVLELYVGFSPNTTYHLDNVRVE
ncbi:MAG: hypothetical protein EXQ52_13890 [Bryobacterales bacterium]|nr:hypothetical protein [Bryobacterales bacterium]